MDDSSRNEIEMIKKRVGQLVVEVEQVRNNFERTKDVFEKAVEQLKKELENEVRGEWSWKKKDDKGD